jgi:predicted nucleic acid-binding protein
VTSAEKAYVDPSALRCLYVHDDRSARFCAWRTRARGALPLTRFGRAELVNSVALAVHRSMLGQDAARAALDDVESDIRAGRLSLVDALWRRTLDLAADLSDQHTARLGTRSLDVLHVATAVTLGMKHFVTYDERQGALARAVGLKLLAP